MAALPLDNQICYKVRRFFTVIFVAASVMAAVGCSRRVESGYRTIPFVNSLLADSLPELHRLAALNGRTSGSIVLAGDPSECLRLSERMMVCDDFDNIDARKVSDGLPDFSGETIVSVLDFADSSYASLAGSETGRDSLRTVAVRGALAALRLPSRCKVLIICSPLFSEYGGGDVRDLFSRIGCDVPVLSSSDTTFSFTDACFRQMREKNLFTHNIAYPSARLFAVVRDSSGSGFRVRPFADSLVPASFPDTVGVIAPNTYYSDVVQNQH